MADNNQVELEQTEVTIACISCSIEANSMTSTRDESQSTYNPPVKPIVLANIAPSNGSLLTILFALSPQVLVSVKIKIVGEWVRTKSDTLLQKLGLRDPLQFHIIKLIETRKMREHKLGG